MTTIHDLPPPSSDALKRSKILEECIRQAIDKRGGFISFAEFMALALYTPLLGYYQAESFNLGKHGDFTTAPEISPLFAHCFARQCLQIFAELGRCDILELGAGTGRFAHDFLQHLKMHGALPAHYYIYEISKTLRQKQQHFLQRMCPDIFPHITWLNTLPTAFTGIILANEVVDAQPVHCFQIGRAHV